MNTSDTVGLPVSVTRGIGWPGMPASALVQASATPAISAYAASAPCSRPIQYALPSPLSPAVVNTVSTQRPLAMSSIRSGARNRNGSSWCATTYTLLPSEHGAVEPARLAGTSIIASTSNAAAKAVPTTEDCRVRPLTAPSAPARRHLADSQRRSVSRAREPEPRPFSWTNG